MSKLKTLIKQEFVQQNRVHNVFAYNFQLIVMISLTLYFLAPHNSYQTIGIVMVVAMPLLVLVTLKSIVKNDVQDGSLDLIMTNCEPGVIILAKYITAMLNITLAVICALPFIILFYNYNITLCFNYLLITLLLNLFVVALAILIDVIEAYFAGNSYLGVIIITPLMLPIIIIGGMFLVDVSHNSLFFLKLLIGLNLISLPIFLLMSSMLIKTINNF